ncbi:MAG: methyl-accepting chemotaxis protein [Nitrospira sp.]
MLTWFGNKKTVTKLMTGFGLSGVIMAVIAVMCITNIMKMRENIENIYTVQLNPLMALTQIRGMVHQTRTNTVTAVLTKSIEDRDAAIGRVQDFTRQIDEKIAAFLPTIKVEEVRKVAEEFVRVYTDYRNFRESTIFMHVKAGDQAAALAAMKGEGAGKFKASLDAINAVIDVKLKVAKGKYDASIETAAETKTTMIVASSIGIMIGLLFGWMIARFLSRNLNDVVKAAQAMGGGDLTARSSVAAQDEVGLLAHSFNEMGEKLEATLTAVRTASESVSTGAEQITKGNEDLSQRTSEQASSLEETSSAMEEMTSTVKQNADNAKQANQLAIAARDIAEKGGTVTSKAIDAMDEINKSSKKIADIITVIDEIAFQTNLLALNAAVEAARAGEHGRGFAVVAAEVRNLAQRSATAAKEIKGLINESVQRVTDGSVLVDQSGKTLTEIVGSVKRVTDIIAEITAASQEQATGIEQVNKAIMQMDETTQQNAALVEEATSASQSMKEQAQGLMSQVAAFKITQTGQEQSRQPNVHSAGPAKKPLFKKQSLSHKAAVHLEPVGVASGNGNDRRQKDHEFEEF